MILRKFLEDENLPEIPDWAVDKHTTRGK